MQVTLERLSEHLGKGLRSIYTVHGEETLLVQEATDAIRAEARKQGYTERESFTASGAHFDWGAIMAAAGAQSLFGDRQILEVHIPSGKPGKEGSNLLQQLAESLQGQDACLAIVTLGRLDKAAKSSAWFMALEQNGVGIQVESVERHQLAPWIAGRLHQQGLRLPSGSEGQYCLQFLVDQVEGNLLAANQEVQKLSLLYPKAELTLAQIQEAVGNVARYDVFKLSEAVLRGEGARVQKMLDGLHAEGVAEVLVHWVLSEDIRSMRRVFEAVQAGRHISQALRENRIWGAKEKLFEHIVPQLRPKIVAQLMQAAYLSDGILKGIKRPDWPSDNWQTLHRLAGLMVKVASR